MAEIDDPEEKKMKDEMDEYRKLDKYLRKNECNDDSDFVLKVKKFNHG